jgi:exodeoxyribonuclease VII large subunit
MLPSSVPVPALPERILSVSELNRLVRDAIERGLPLLWVAGEVSNLSHAASGHTYFSLKDEGAQVRCVLWRNRAQLIGLRLANGMRVEARALATLYEPRGDYQLNVEMLRRAGIGALYEAFARLKEKLAREGLFDVLRKRPLPACPRQVGVVTSLQAAALRDVLSALRRRAPAIAVKIYPAAVQGEGAAGELARALAIAGRHAACEVLILCRGGGGIEDLWAFNDEALARAIAACPIPVVTGIGHETDATIADFVADLRAATPTAAAEMVSAGYVEAAGRLPELTARVARSMERCLEVLQQRLDFAGSRLIHPGERLARLRADLARRTTGMASSMERSLELASGSLEHIRFRLAAARPRLVESRLTLAHLGQRLRAAWERELRRRSDRIDALASHLAHLDPRQVLERGYAIVRDADGRVVRDSSSLRPGGEIALQFALGHAAATVTKTE